MNINESLVLRAAHRAGVPPEAFLLGSAGEYELLAFVPEDAVPDGGSVCRVGSFSRTADGGIFYRLPGGRKLRHQPLPDPREVCDLDRYRDRVIDLARRLFGGGGRP